MGLFDRIFNSNKNNISEISNEDRLKVVKEEEKVSFDKEIDTIELALKNLGLLDSIKIEDIIKKQGFKYDKSVLNRLRVNTSEDKINNLHKYFDSVPIGYGSVTLSEIRKSLEKISKEKMNEGKNHHEIVEELIDEARYYIKSYEDKLVKLNEIVGNLENNSNSESEVIAMMDYWTEYYKEHEFGYPIDLTDKVNSMIIELKNLEYGGYGIDEINKFRSNCNKIIEEGKLNEEKASDTFNRINTTLFLPKKNKYLADVEILKRKIQMINDSPALNDEEKEQNIEETITGFNELYGHVINLNERLEDMISKLKSLQYGGYGEHVIDDFRKYSLKIIEDGKRVNKSVNSILSKIKVEYNILIRKYNTELDRLNTMITQLEDFSLSSDEKRDIKREYVQEFKDAMGHKINVDERIDYFVNNLKSLDHGGYGDSKIKEFKDKCRDMINSTKDDYELVTTMKNIYELYKNMVTEYKDKYQDLRESIDKVNNDLDITDEEKTEELNDYERAFKAEVGYSMDFDNIINGFADGLRKLPLGGYGDSVINEFIDESKNIVSSDENDKKKYDRISRKANILTNRYINNMSLFNEWKNRQLEEYVLDNKEAKAEELDNRIKYMLSLSPKELNDYYMEDDKKIKDKYNKHNFMAAFKYLAKMEAKDNKNDLLYDKRLLDLENGINPYTDDDINNAMDELEAINLFEDGDISEELKIYSIVDILDKTLIKQISSINNVDDLNIKKVS